MRKIIYIVKDTGMMFYQNKDRVANKIINYKNFVCGPFDTYEEAEEYILKNEQPADLKIEKLYVKIEEVKNFELDKMYE